MTAYAERRAVARTRWLDRAADVVAGNGLLFVFVGVLGAALLMLAQQLTVADSWMTLVAGRDVVEHGLPHHETLTVMAAGRTWTDQQWLAQVLFYEGSVVGGLRLALVLDAVLITLTYAVAIAAARSRGASARSTLVVAAASILVAPWSWQLRAQTLALPLFAIVLWLASSEVRTPRRRTFLALPLLVLWANVHGSVLVGALLVSLVGVIGLGRRVLGASDAPPAGRSLALAVLPWGCLLVSPYSYHLVGYYRLMLFTSTVSKVIVEWKAPTPHGIFLAFFVLAACTTALVIVKRRLLALYDIAALALTLAMSLHSIRGIVWFDLACLVLLPVALDGVFRGAGARIRRPLAFTLAGTAAGLCLLALAVTAVRPASWFEKQWPAAAAQEAATAAAHVDGPQAVFPSDRYADWLLWKEPPLEGRVAYDVRFEILAAPQIAALVRFKTKVTGSTVASGYPVLVLDPTDGAARIRTLLEVPGTRVLYRDRRVVVVSRSRTA